jgi:hypothetical protein
MAQQDARLVSLGEAYLPPSLLRAYGGGGGGAKRRSAPWTVDRGR